MKRAKKRNTQRPLEARVIINAPLDYFKDLPYRGVVLANGMEFRHFNDLRIDGNGNYYLDSEGAAPQAPGDHAT